MDTQIDWKVSEDFEGLLETIMVCKRDLTKCCFSKFGAAKIVDYSVIAPQKVCDLLVLSGNNTPVKTKENDRYCHKAVSQFDHFKLFKTKLFGDDKIRVEAIFEVGDGSCKTWYGNITLI